MAGRGERERFPGSFFLCGKGLGEDLGDGVMVGPGVLEFVGEIDDGHGLAGAGGLADEGIDDCGTDSCDQPDDLVHFAFELPWGVLPALHGDIGCKVKDGGWQ